MCFTLQGSWHSDAVVSLCFSAHSHPSLPPPPTPLLPTQLSGSLQARTITASHVADLLAAAGGDWSKVVALLTGQAGTGAATGSGNAAASGSDGAAVTVNGASDARN